MGSSLYITNTGVYKIDVSSVAATSNTELINYSSMGITVDGAYAITLDTVNNKIYWGTQNSSTNPKQFRIHRMNTDGGNPETILTESTLNAQPFYIEIDTENNKIYWSETDSNNPDNNTINRANLDGTNPFNLHTSGSEFTHFTLIP